MTDSTTVTVVGAGPVGLSAATQIRNEGFPVVVLEEDLEIGKPTNCSGLISASGVSNLRLNLDSCLQSYIYGANIHSPNGTKLEIRRDKPVANLVNRYEFDKMFERKAIKCGVEIKCQSKFLDFNNGTVFFKENERGAMLKSDYLIGADGAKSQVRKLLGYTPQNEDFIHSYQETVRGNFQTGIVELFFGNNYHGLFAWIIPINDNHAKVGIGVKMGEQNPMKQLNDLKEKKGFEWETLGKESFLIPWQKPFPSFVKEEENILLAGDAAFQTKATTGGGLIIGLECAKYLSDTVCKNLKNGTPLSSYNSKCSSIKKELEIHNKISKHIYSLSDNKIDKLFFQLKEAGVEEFLAEHGDMDKPSRFASKVLKKPSFWKFAPTAMKILF